MQSWTTLNRPEREQFSYWREVLCAAFAPLSPERVGRRSGRGIASEVRSAPLGDLVCAEVRSNTQRIVHGPAEVRATQDDVVFVNLQIAGTCGAAQDGRTTVVSPGQFAVFDTRRPYVLDYRGTGQSDEWNVLCFRVPRVHLGSLASSSDDITCQPYGSEYGSGAVAVATMRSVWQNREALQDSRGVQTALVTLLSAHLESAVQPSTRSGRDGRLLAAAQRYVAAHLGLGLTPGEVAAHLGVSVRKLHALYAASGTSFGRSVLELRLDACHRRLTDPGERRSITRLATDLGFSDLSHLDRTFKGRYGVRPGEVRRLHRTADSGTVEAIPEPAAVAPSRPVPASAPDRWVGRAAG